MDHLKPRSPINVLSPGSPAYEYWNSRSNNLRMKGDPRQIIPVSSVEELTIALQETVNTKYRLAIRGGGHCLENFVTDPAVDVIIDISQKKE